MYPAGVPRVTLTPKEQAAAFVARYGPRAAKTARERLAAATKRGSEREVERYWRDVEHAIEAMQEAGEAPVPVWGSVPKGDEKRSRAVLLKVTPTWHELVKDAAAAAGLSVTEWVMQACERQARRGSARRA